MTPIRGLLFDKDGTLFDFVATWIGVFDDTLAALSDDPARQRTMALAVGYDPDARSFRHSSVPVIFGISQSEMTTVGLKRITLRKPSSPLRAQTT